MTNKGRRYSHQPPIPALQWGFWMQFWAAIYALHRVYPQPRLTAFVAALLVVLAALIYDSRPATSRGGAA